MCFIELRLEKSPSSLYVHFKNKDIIDATLSYSPPPSLASQSRTGSLHFNDEKVVDRKLAEEALEGIKRDFAKDPKLAGLFQAIVDTAINPLVGDALKVRYEQNVVSSFGGEESTVSILNLGTEGSSHGISTAHGISDAMIAHWRNMLGDFVPEAIWKAVLPDDIWEQHRLKY